MMGVHDAPPMTEVTSISSSSNRGKMFVRYVDDEALAKML
jgi:hypothetical protein